MLSSENRALEKRLEDYHFEYVKLKRRVNLLEAEIENLDECADMKTVVDLIHEIVPSIIAKKGLKGAVHKASCCSFYSFKSSEDSDSDEIIKGSHRYQVREKKDVPHKQRRKARSRKIKRVVV